MIGFVKGTLAEKGAGYVIIEAGGIGYEISCRPIRQHI